MRNAEFLWFRLFSATGFGPKAIHYIFNTLKTDNADIEDLFSYDENEFNTLFPELGRGRFSKATFYSLHETDNKNIALQFNKLEDEGIHIIGLGDNRYPKSVLEIMNDNAPIVLYCKGNLKLLNQRGVSIVGARDVDNFAVMLTKEIAHTLGGEGYNVTSGYAKGVDTSAHLGALEGEGTTTMILSFGVNYITIKRELKDLNWERNALFVTQFAPYEKFSGQNAMARNKLVCAMSQALVVIQSGPERNNEGKMSGTFDAGKTALQMQLPVFVLSPTVLSTSPRGNYDLIRLGGIEFTNGKDIVNSLNKHTNLVSEELEPKVLNGHTTKLNGKLQPFKQLTMF